MSLEKVAAFCKDLKSSIRKHPSLIVSLVASILSFLFSIYCIFYGSKELSKIALITALCASTGGLCCFLLFGRPLY
jgi:hypothetical protein